ncbi:MAG: hypothetical protein M3Q33_00805 [Acidobacteriota bacterium]|nr:hypothetical protein [Acidobacteriota bacterium]
MPEFNKIHKKKEEYRLPIAKLYPNLTPEQQREAEYFLTQYLEIINRIYEESVDLTNSDLNTTV